MDSLQEKLNHLSKLTKETIGATFQILHNDQGLYKIIMIARKGASKTPTRQQKLYTALQFGEMLDDTIKMIEDTRRPADDANLKKKPYTLHKF